MTFALPTDHRNGRVSEPVGSVDEAVLSRLKHYDLAYLTGAPWRGIRYHKQIWCERLVPNMRRVLYFENVPTRTITPRDLLRAYKRTRPAAAVQVESGSVQVVSDLILPEPTWLAGPINELRLRRTLRRLAIEPGRSIVITNAPGNNVLRFVKLARPAVLIYDCDHNYSDCAWVPRSAVSSESDLVRIADCIVCDSRYLWKKWASSNRMVVQIPPGVDEDRIAKHPSAVSTKAAEVVAYFGTLRNDIDIELLNQLAIRFRVVVIGAITQALATPLSPSVSLIHCTSQAAMFEHLKQADALVMPYLLNSYTAAILPAKVFEALATGLPIIATPLPELEPYREHIYTASTTSEFISILETLPSLETLERKQARLAAARANSWDRRCSQLLSVLGALLEQRLPFGGAQIGNAARNGAVEGEKDKY